MGTRQYHALLRPGDGKLVLHTLYYGDEVRALEAKWKAVAPSPDEVTLGAKLIDALARDFDPTKYADEHRTRLLELIRAKGEGRQVVVPEARPEAAKVVDLMEALRQSIAEVRKPLAKAEPATRPAAATARGKRAAGAAQPARKAARK
jgi:DNA end-binding protein Ku